MAEYSLFGTATPTGNTNRTDGPWTLANEFYVTRRLWLLAIRWWRNVTTGSGTVTGQVFQVATATTGSAVTGTLVTFTLSGTGWHQAYLSSPVALVADQRYRVAVRVGTNFSQISPYWMTTGAGASGLNRSGLLMAPNGANAIGGFQGLHAVAGSSIAFPALASGANENWHADVLVTDIDPTGQAQTQFLPYHL